MSLLSCFLSWVLLQAGGATTPEPQRLTADGFQRAFEKAFDRGETPRVEQLVRENPTEFVALFEKYGRIWIDQVGEPKPEDRKALERCRAIAKAAAQVFEARGLLEMQGSLEGFDPAKRARWREAKADFDRGNAAYLRFQWSEALEPLARADAALGELGWLSGMARARNTLGICYGSLGQHKKALECLEKALPLKEKLGNPQEVSSSLNNLGICYDVLGQVEKAIEYHERALALREKIDHPQDLAASLNNLGTCYSALGQLEKAIGYHEKALALREKIDNLQDLAASLDNLGNCYDALGQVEKAIEYHKKALALEERIGNPQSLASSLHSLGNCYHSLGQYENAIENHEKAIALREKVGNPQALAGSLDGLGICYFSLGQYEKAIEHHERAGALFEKVGDPRGLGASLTNLGSCYHALAQYEKAIGYHERAMESLERIGNPQEIAASLANLGNCYFSLGQHEKAIEYHRKALALREKIGNPQDLASSLGSLGSCYDSLGQYEKAIRYHEKAFALQEPVGNPRDLAVSLANLGNGYDSLGQYEKAIAYQEKALLHRERVGNPQDLAGSLTCLGWSYYSLGQFDKAVAYHLKALPLRERIGNPQGLADTLDGLGAGYHALGQYNKAIEYHEKALALRATIGNSKEVASTVSNLGNCYYSLGQFARAIAYYEKALAVEERIENSLDSSATRNGLGACHAALGQYDKAIGYFEAAFALARKIGNPQKLADSLNNLGACYDALGQPEKALTLLEECVTELGKIGRRSLPEEGRGAFLAGWYYFPALVSRSVCPLQNNPSSRALERGFPLVEAFLGRTLLEGLQEKTEDVLSMADVELSAKRVETLDRMEAVRLRLAREAQTDPESSALVADLKAQLDEAQKAWVEIDHRLRQKNPKLSELVAPEPASLRSVQSALAADEALLLFVVGEQESFLWAITSDKASLLRLPGGEVIDKACERLASSLSSVERMDASFVEPARELYKFLLAPAETLLESRKRWIVVPDRALGFLPFEVLLTADVPAEKQEDLAHLPYLLRDRSIRYAPSASLFVWFASHGKREKNWKKDLVLFGDPVYSSEREYVEPLAMAARGSLDLEGFARLEKTRQEVKAIGETLISDTEAKVFLQLRDLPRSGHVGASRFDLYVGQEASRSRLTQDLTGYRIVHLAVHGFFDTQFPWFSGLVLSDEPRKKGSGFVNLIEIGTLKLDAQIVFLSACETAKGKLEKCDGIKSTARSFLLAGAQSVIATQWGVIDEAAPIVAEAFYRRLFEGAAPVDALRQAKLALIEQREVARGVGGVASSKASDRDRRRWAHPAFWAPFVLWGG